MKFEHSSEQNNRREKFAIGDVVTCTIENEIEFTEFIGSAYFNTAKNSRFSEYAATLIKLAAKSMMGLPFVVEYYYVPEKNKPDRMKIRFDGRGMDMQALKEKMLSDPEVKEASDTFNEQYKTDLIFFLITDAITVEAAEFTQN